MLVRGPRDGVCSPHGARVPTAAMPSRSHSTSAIPHLFATVAPAVIMKSRCVRALLSVFLTASAVSMSMTADAQSTRPSVARESPAALLRQADAAYDVRDFARALQLYRRAYELQRDPTVLFNVGQMYAALEQWSDAAATWRLYLERVPAAPNRASTEAAIRSADEHVQSQRGATSEPRPATGPQPLTNNSDTSAPPPHVQPARTEARQRWPIGAWVVTGIGGTAVVTGAVLLGLYAASVAELESPAHCTARVGGFDCDPDAAPIRDRAQSFATAGTIAMSAGGAAVVGGLVWAIAGRTTELVPVVSVTNADASIRVVGRF